MRSVSIACLGGILIVFLLLSGVRAQFSHETDQSDIQQHKQGIARTESGEEIGSVVDFIIDLPTGRILLAVVSPATTQGEATSVLLLPWRLAHVNATGNIFDFKIATDTIRSAPRLSAKRWKQPPTLHWLTEVETHWHAPAAQLSLVPPRSAMILGKATALIGMRVQEADSTLLGTIRELVFDPQESAIALVILARSVDSPEQNHREFTILPWEQLYLQPQSNTLIAVAGRKILT